MRAVVVEQLGGPEALRVRQWPAPEPGPGELLVDITLAGVNFMDTGARSRGASHGRLPFVPGVEAVGRVAALGDRVTGFEVGDRVCWVYAYGSYAEQLAVPASAAVPVPDQISDEIAAALMMQGMTAHHFVTDAAPLAAGETALVHAAAGGTGRLLCQLLRLRGVRVIGLVSRPEKVEIAKAAGAAEVVVSTGGDFVEHVRKLTGGEGVHAVFDGGGGSTFTASVAVTRRLGTLLYYGAVIDDVPLVRLTDLPNSIRVCYPVFRDHYPTREALLAHTGELFDLVRKGELEIEIGGRYPLGEAERAHRDLESRATTGKLLIDVRA